MEARYDESFSWRSMVTACLSQASIVLYTVGTDSESISYVCTHKCDMLAEKVFYARNLKRLRLYAPHISSQEKSLKLDFQLAR